VELAGAGVLVNSLDEEEDTLYVCSILGWNGWRLAGPKPVLDAESNVACWLMCGRKANAFKMARRCLISP